MYIFVSAGSTNKQEREGESEHLESRTSSYTCKDPRSSHLVQFYPPGCKKLLVPFSKTSDRNGNLGVNQRSVVVVVFGVIGGTE